VLKLIDVPLRPIRILLLYDVAEPLTLKALREILVRAESRSSASFPDARLNTYGPKILPSSNPLILWC